MINNLGTFASKNLNIQIARKGKRTGLLEKKGFRKGHRNGDGIDFSNF